MKKFHCSICDKNHFLFYSTESPLPNEVLDYEDSKDVTQLSEDAYVIKKEHLIFAAHINVTTEIPNYEIHYKVWVKLNVKDFDEKFEMALKTDPNLIKTLAEEIGKDILKTLKEEALDPVEDVLKDAETFFVDLGESVSEFAKDVGDGIVEGGKYVGGKTEEGFNAVGDSLGLW